MKSNLLTMTLSLTLIAAGMGAALGLVHQVTAEPIAQAEAKAKAEALAQVQPAFASHAPGEPVQVTVAGDSRPVDVYPVYVDGKLDGCAVETWTMDGFSGEITIMAGFDASGAITGYKVLSHAETPGLGAKADDWFRSPDGHRSIIGTTAPLAVTKDNGDIDGITAATITSRAVLQAVNRARQAYNQFKTDNP